MSKHKHICGKFMGQKLCRMSEAGPREGYYFVQQVRKQVKRAQATDIIVPCQQCAIALEHYAYGPDGGMSKAEGQRRAALLVLGDEWKRRLIINATSTSFATIRAARKATTDAAKRRSPIYSFARQMYDSVLRPDLKRCLTLNQGYFSKYRVLP